MPTIHSNRRTLGFAIAAILGLLFATDGASACSMMAGKGNAACEPICGCCQTANPGDLGNASSAIELTRPRIDAGACENAATGDCCCRSEAPPASESKSERFRERRVETNQDVSTTRDAFEFAAERCSPTIAVRRHPQPRSPLYLLHSRLLI